MSATGSSAGQVTLGVHRERIREMRHQAQTLRRSGATGSQVAHWFSLSLDAVLIETYQTSLWQAAAGRGDVYRRLIHEGAMVAIGGTGRGDLAPYSDLDLMFLHHHPPSEAWLEAVAVCVRQLWDSGLQVGHRVIGVGDVLRLAPQDPHFATALLEVRLLYGNERLVHEQRNNFRFQLKRHRSSYLQACLASRLKEREQSHGNSVHLLEPDVKRSVGGLRDLQLIRWFSIILSGWGDWDSLRWQRLLTSDEIRVLRQAYDYLMTIRIDLHGRHQRAHDILTREDQLILSELWQIAGRPGQKPVECFMQKYFMHTTRVAEIAERFVARVRPLPWWRRWHQGFTQLRLDGTYLIGTDAVDVLPRLRVEQASSLDGILRLAITAARYRRNISWGMQELIQRFHGEWSVQPFTQTTGGLLWELLNTPGHLGPVLRVLDRLDVLATLIPALRGIRCLLQFNQYHAYTVDEHTLRCIEAVEKLLGDTSPLGEAYRAVKPKALLHLALLLHDAGKGREEDHCDVGASLAAETADRLGLSAAHRDTLVFLVKHHLEMAKLAFRRDTHDPEVLLRFTHLVGSPERLQMLYVHTVADLMAVAPHVWNDWKADLLAGLYQRSMVWLNGQASLLAEENRRQEIIQRVHRVRPQELSLEEVSKHLQHFPSHYWLATPPERLAEDLLAIRQLQPQDILTDAAYDHETSTMEYRVITSEQVTRGCFHKLTGVLSALRMEILSALICTSDTGIIIDSYRVIDHDHAGEVPDFRREEVRQMIQRVLRGDQAVDELFHKRRRVVSHQRRGPVSDLPSRIVFDNDASDRCTVLDVFAHDRPGLLYTIARTLFEYGLSVELARIATHFDQVVDVFYITTLEGEKLTQPERLQALQSALEQRLRELEDA
ncbi:MAG: bifunctional uridylyltransferase/uridylyl-removing enzyme [Planctomycetaceae bacterium]|nr:MAG: bifunctional uridylyltransferase/uridylyl-removing enzyme [Planctomycetaceae bacterium]